MLDRTIVFIRILKNIKIFTTCCSKTTTITTAIVKEDSLVPEGGEWRGREVGKMRYRMMIIDEKLTQYE